MKHNLLLISCFALALSPLFAPAKDKLMHGPSPDIQDTTKLISQEKAEQLANDYLKSKNIDWGKPDTVALVDHSSSILVEGKDHQMHEESWDSCYYVQYQTSKSEREETGIRTVIVTRDGLKVAIPTSE